jgi:hypothetical protein
MRFCHVLFGVKALSHVLYVLKEAIGYFLIPFGISPDHVLPHMKASKTVKKKHIMVYRYNVLRHPPK